MTIDNGYYWRIDANKDPIDIEIVDVVDGKVWVIGCELSMPIEYLTESGITIVPVEPPGIVDLNRPDDHASIPKDENGKPYFTASQDGWIGKWHAGETIEATKEMMFDVGEWCLGYNAKDSDTGSA